MKVVVLIKQTPDTAELPKVSADDVQSGAVNATMVINPWDEFAAEEAILLCERFDGEAIAISAGAPGAVDALKHAIAMGIPEAVLVDDAELRAGDLWATAAALAAALRAQGPVDVVLTGRQSVDDNSGAVFAGVAANLGYGLLTNVVKVVDIADGAITVERQLDGVQATVKAPLPVVISVAKEINEPRYPSFMGIRKANRAQIPTVTLAELGMTAPAPTTRWTNIRKPEVRRTEVQIIDGGAVQEKAAKLADALLADKVI
ncbi:MAG: electron transfer flavoprotein subunit beta/FixA family protein [Caldilineaceae bacterium]|nr:electron transfer flavoprotein subunit beta/FixA family protein [Caldilineaceae bacterium]